MTRPVYPTPSRQRGASPVANRPLQSQAFFKPQSRPPIVSLREGEIAQIVE